MTKPSGNDADSQKEEKDVATASSWGTWEELILAFAVNRHGTGAWDLIASELTKRTSNPSLEFTAHNCRLQYINLKRRFGQNDVEEYEESDVVEESVPLLEELRKLRVAELRREVQRYDLNIESLESKMKKLKDEREKSLKTESDPEIKNEDITPTASTAPETRGHEPDAGEEPEKDRLSVNESNSTYSTPQNQQNEETPHEPDRTGEENVIPDRTPTEPEETKPSVPDPKPANEDSCNGSSNSVEKETNRVQKTEPVTESIGSEDNNKENSDVQSEVSRSKKDEEEGSDKERRGTASGGERGHVDEPRAVKEEIESGPLIEILKFLMGNKFGSVFQRRLKSQETAKYNKLIFQHVDLETIESRAKEGWYSSSIDKFFRDLLLLVNNALVYFPKNSSEAKAATELRRLVSKEMSQKYSKSDSSSGKHVSLQSLSKHEESEPSNSLALKPRLSGPMIVCRKRSSIAKASSSSGTNKKKEQIEEVNNTTKVEQRQSSPPLSSNSEEPKITKKRTRDRFPSVSTSAKKNGKNQSNNNKTTESGKHGKGSSASREAKNDSNTKKKKNQTSTESKKRGAADFLNRMKQSSSPNKGDLLDALKNTPLTGGEGSSSKRGGEKREQQTNKRNTESNKQQAKEKGSPAKKNIGRPPKRGAAQPPPPPPPKLGKRARGGETEMPPSKQQPKKRSKK